MHVFWNNLNLKPSVARKLAIRHTSFVCLTASFLATGGFIKLFHKIPCFFHDYSGFFKFHDFPMHGTFWWFSRFSMISRACGNPGFKTSKLHCSWRSAVAHTIWAQLASIRYELRTKPFVWRLFLNEYFSKQGRPRRNKRISSGSTQC